jgi:ABC-type transporter lipoprotein component MlaA
MYAGSKPSEQSHTSLNASHTSTVKKAFIHLRNSKFLTYCTAYRNTNMFGCTLGLRKGVARGRRIRWPFKSQTPLVHRGVQGLHVGSKPLQYFDDNLSHHIMHIICIVQQVKETQSDWNIYTTQCFFFYLVHRNPLVKIWARLRV